MYETADFNYVIPELLILMDSAMVVPCENFSTDYKISL
jgi:hypothetical protein